MTDSADLEEALALAMQDVNFDEMEQDIELFAQEPSVREVLEVGIDLQNYSTTIAKELEVAQAESIHDYMRHVDDSAQIKQEIDICDHALAVMEERLGEFKGSLGQLSSDICTLQTKSQAITIKLTNRKNLESYLGSFAKDVSVSKEFVQKIVNGEVGPNYTKYLIELSRKIELLNDPRVRQSSAAKDIRLPMDCLRLKASDNIRAWLVTQINQLRDHYGTEQMAIQEILLRSKYVITFLKVNSPEIERSIRDYYISILSRIYLENFKLIARRVLRQMMPISMSQETLSPITVQRSFLSTKRVIGAPTQFFAMRDRVKLINDILSPPQPFTDGMYPVEALMRSLGQIVIDAFTAESYFACEFFQEENMGVNIFHATLNFLDSFLGDLLSKIQDPLCLLFLVRFNLAQQEELRSRQILKLESHLTSMRMKIIDRFKSLCAINVAAIEESESDLLVQGPITTKPSPLCARYQEFVSSVARIMTKELTDVVEPEMKNIQDSVWKLINKISKEYAATDIQYALLVKDCYWIVASLSDERVPATASLAFWQKQLEESTAKYVDIELNKVFAGVIKISSAEQLSGISEADLKDTVNDFKEKHVSNLKAIISDLKGNFGDFVGKQMFELIAKRLFGFWTKFERVCEEVVKNGKSQPWFTNILTVRQQLVSNIRLLPELFDHE